MSPSSDDHKLTRRERQIMDILYAQGEASVTSIHEQLSDPPAHTAIRTMLKILDRKGLIKRKKVGREFLYRAKPQRIAAGQSAMDRVVQIFFDGSLEKAVGAYLTSRKTKIDEQTYHRLTQMIDEARRQGR